VTRFQPSQRGRDAESAERLSTPYAAEDLRHLVARYGSPLMIIDCDVIRSQYRRLAAALPGVALHYALKPLPELAVVRALKDIGSRFDLASSGEVELVRKAGVPAEHCIHTHPIKSDGDIRDALRFGIRTFVVDNVDEIGKFVRYRKKVELLLRVAFRASDTVCDLSKKFGCEAGAVPGLLEVAKRLGLTVAGLSFHVGSQTATPAMHVEAIRACGALISAARDAGQGPLSVLDIGGGFPADYRDPVMSIETFCAPIREALAVLPSGVRVIAEPGRFIAAPSGTCITSVVGRAQRAGRWWFYLDDGIYGSFGGQLFDHASYPLAALRESTEWVDAVLAGPTCDSIDVIDETLRLPLLEAGDLIVGRSMGAYNSATATDFNFIRRARVLAVNVSADAELAPPTTGQ
jgi:ornithine decarboxylase